MTVDDLDIEAVMLFGSTARGENDELSDLDILIIYNDVEIMDLLEKKKRLSQQLNIPVSWISLYNLSTMKKMASQGSYFIWHLKKEGKLLYSKNDEVSKIFSKLEPYKNMKNDLSEYRIICDDIKKSISRNSSTVDYELSLLASVIRNTCITIAYIDNKYLFGRVSPVEYVLNLYEGKFLFDVDEYINLYKFRIKYIRDNLTDLKMSGDISTVEKWLEIAEKLIEYAIIKLKGCE
jgi:predicted nucleotidyltransferase